MVAKLTYGKKQWEYLNKQMKELLPPMHSSMLEVIEMVDKDIEAFK